MANNNPFSYMSPQQVQNLYGQMLMNPQAGSPQGEGPKQPPMYNGWEAGAALFNSLGDTKLGKGLFDPANWNSSLPTGSLTGF